ncbi:MAG: ABC transporter permease [Candidatus Altiarchaeales archaeon]|nr:ABC transporter permease [Candidatus Altiarchaeota archaeon]MCG2783386.1 ABC transporter permease [Candidatus Altiarchaeales archaeon]MBU4265749.1 ABC transporter permease [Candidatus Altiarchaeota archaeon]MBU4341509.1 ABC transporter permease [Candidatus Altiarchaeota archaeon]MBU4406699.1 ABC transporter permease [Candidatus Altiarchaeota archaeon]
MWDDFFRLSVLSITRRGMRSWLTMMGIFIGIAAIVSLISLGDGLQNAINEQFELLGSNVIYVMPGGVFHPGGSASKLTDHELDIVKRIRGVEKAGGMITSYSRVEFKGETEFGWISGLDPDLQDLFLDGTGVEIVKGQKKFKPSDTYKAAIGYRYWSGDIFEKPVDVGDTIEIDDKKFDVVAFVSEIGNPEDDKNIYIPAETAKELFGVEDDYMVIMVKTKPNYEPDDVAEDIEKDLRKDRGLDVGEEDFQVMTLNQMMESVGIVLDAVQAILIGIAAISLFVGGVGIMNTMYTSVLERTQEIGLMKAIGARNQDVLYLFMFESGIIGTVGGVIGCVIGAGLAKVVEVVAAAQLGTGLVQAQITPELCIGAVAFSLIVGCISGVLPARQASQLKPVDALRYE